MADNKSSDRLKRAGDFFRQKEYEKSLEELDLLLMDDPNNMYARAAREKVRTARDLAHEIGGVERRQDIEVKKRMAIEQSQSAEHKQLLAKIEEEGRKRREEEMKKRHAEDERRIREERFHRYQTALIEAWSDGTLSDIEIQHLAELRMRLKIPDQIHTTMQRNVQLDAYISALRQACEESRCSISKPDTFENIRTQYGVSLEEHMSVASAIAWQLRVHETKGAVVIVDDDPLVLRMLRMNFEQAGYIVESFNDCEDAHVFIKTHRPDLIVTDVIFTPPKINGFEFLERVRSDPRLVAVPFLCISAMSDRPRILAGLKLGIDDYFSKPIDFALLLASAEGKIRHFHELINIRYGT
jgi:CheY-like chemotaxis protein